MKTASEAESKDNEGREGRVCCWLNRVLESVVTQPWYCRLTAKVYILKNYSIKTDEWVSIWGMHIEHILDKELVLPYFIPGAISPIPGYKLTISLPDSVAAPSDLPPSSQHHMLLYLVKWASVQGPYCHFKARGHQYMRHCSALIRVALGAALFTWPHVK